MDDLVIGTLKQPGNKQNLSAVNSTQASPVSVKTTQTTSTINTPELLPKAKITPPSLFTHLSPDTKPIATKSRRQSPANQRFIRAEINKLLRSGIIRPSVSPWRAQAFVTKEDNNHKKRMVVDYSETINRFTELDAYPMPNAPQMIEEMSQYQYYSTYDLRCTYHQIPIQDDCNYTAF